MYIPIFFHSLTSYLFLFLLSTCSLSQTSVTCRFHQRLFGDFKLVNATAVMATCKVAEPNQLDDDHIREIRIQGKVWRFLEDSSAFKLNVPDP